MRKASAEKDDQYTYDERRNKRHSRHRCGTGRARRTGEGPVEERRRPEEGRAQGPQNRLGLASPTAASPKKQAKASKKAGKPERNTAAPRAESKGAKILKMIGRAKGATLAEIMKATEWQAHSVRGFISTAGKKQGITIESARSEAGERTYKIAK
jgi:hypothetical protein